MKKYLVTCDPGFEDIAKREIDKKAKAKAESFFNFSGKLLVRTAHPNRLFRLHSLHHVVELKKTFILKQPLLEEIYRIVKETRIDELKKISTFRVTSSRFGVHPFSSLDIQKIAGKALCEKYAKKVSLENFDLNIRVDLIGTFGFVGIQYTKQSLYKRFKKAFNHIASIKATIAYGMITLAEIKKNDVVLDPMCGSGTIVMELASLFRDKIKIIAMDISSRCVEGTQENVKLNGFSSYVEVKKGDATQLEKYNLQVNKVITNPPYGIKSGKKKDLRELYSKFLSSLGKVLYPEGRAVIINLHGAMFRRVIMKTGLFKIVHERVVESGGLFPHVFVIERLLICFPVSIMISFSFFKIYVYKLIYVFII